GGSGPFHVASENIIEVGNTSGKLFYSGATNGNDLPLAFPKGYKAFYIMKYEISQIQYWEFLNTLTPNQFATRTAGASKYIMSNNASAVIRNGITAQGCDFNSNGVYNEADDGQWIACNYLSWADLAAYTDWAALRPFTELEFEKACRGPVASFSNEYAWGSTAITQATSIFHSGRIDEAANNDGANCSYGNHGSVQGPLRCGFAVKTSTDCGSSYYGVMDLSGNLDERPVNVVTGSGFTGYNGNGALNAADDGDVANWPLISAAGVGFRGGNWFSSAASYLRVSDRSNAANTNATRYSDSGGRAARTSP
ncbi:MAG: SUMF1/EgtB/PvdO family nonheme iron enzyme, partial [Pseudanabaena sp. ELA748]